MSEGRDVDRRTRRDLERRRAARRRQIRRRRLVALAGVCAAVVVLVIVVDAVAGGGNGAPQRHTHPPRPSSRDARRSNVSTAPKVDGDTPITVDAVGDTMMGSNPYGLPSDNGRDLFASTDQYLRADISIVDQEGTLTNATQTKCGSDSTECYAFTTPPAYAANLRAAGFNVANVANNHTDDAGPAGLTDTLHALTQAHIASVGMPGQFTIMHVGKVAVAVLGFAPYTWCANSLRLGAVSALVRKARREANVVIVYFHAGAQGADETNVGPGDESVFGNPQGNIRVLAHTFVDAGADLVIGTGPHVLRGIEFYRGKMIDYSLGNFLGYGSSFGLGGNLSTSAVLQATITAAGRFVSARLDPVELNGVGVPSPGGSAIPLVRSVSASDFGSQSARISESGQIEPPTTANDS